MIVDRIIMRADGDLFACLRAFKLANNGKWLLNEAGNYCLLMFSHTYPAKRRGLMFFPQEFHSWLQDCTVRMEFQNPWMRKHMTVLTDQTATTYL